MKRRSGLSVVLTVVLLIAIPLFELWLLIKVGESIGVLPTVGIIIAEALLGGWLMKREGRSAWKALNVSLAEGRAPTRELTDAALVLVGGVLLIFPGLFTDLIGLICLIPFTRPLARLVLGLFMARRLASFSIHAPGLNRAGGYRGDPGDVIEGEVVEEPDRARDPNLIRGELDDR